MSESTHDRNPNLGVNQERSTKRSRPTGSDEAAKSLDGDYNEYIPNRLQDAAALCRGYAVVQIRKDEQISRRVYMSLHSAVKAQQRAERAGRQSVLVLCELVPVLPAPVRLVDGAITDPLGRIIDARTGEVVA